MRKLFLLILCVFSVPVLAQVSILRTEINKKADSMQSQVVAWRRDFHEHPELSTRDFRTSAIIAKHLQALGIEVKTSIATTGVVSILRGAKPGPVVALRADMDDLPVTERRPVTFASKVKTMYDGRETGVMHACG